MGKHSILFEHNQKAYESAVSMMEQTGKAAVVHPTGTGKSFIAFQLCADRRGKKICWLSPSEYIFQTQKEKWRSAGGEELGNVEFITYARLMRMKEAEMKAVQPDYLILDEFHRCGAKQWGGGVERLRRLYPEAFVLGLSATSVRYLDNQRDMAWELFDGNIASELTLGAAVVQGILPVPKYVLSVYSYQKELKKYEERVRQAKNQAVRDQAEKELEALRRALEKADGLAEVFARHMLAGSGCSGTGMMETGDVVSPKLDFKYEKNEFRKENDCFEEKAGEEKRAQVEKAKETGEAEKKKREAKETGKAEKEERETDGTEKETPGQKVRKEEESRGEKEDLAQKNAHTAGKYIVFCASYEHLVEMRELATEWFAKVDAEPHIYTAYSDDPEAAEEFQAFQVDKSRHLKLLYCIDMLNEGIHVDGIDGVILLRPTVSPTIYKQQIGRALAAGGKKTPVIFDIVMNIENLCSIGVVEEELREAVLFCRANGRADEIVQEHFQIMDELGDCRRLFAQLNETLSASWEAMYAMAKEYYAGHGNLEIPAKYTTPDGYSLGAWITTQRKVYLGKVAGSLSGEQIRKLNAIGMCWEGVQETAWERNFAEAEKYFKEHGDLSVPADYVAESGCKLGRWVRRQREKYCSLAAGIEENKSNMQDIPAGKGKVAEEDSRLQELSLSGDGDAGIFAQTKEEGEQNKADEKRKVLPGQAEFHLRRMERLAQIGMHWENTDPWEKKYLLAKRYYEENGSLKMPADYVVEGVWLERWLREQKVRLEEEVGGDKSKCGVRQMENAPPKTRKSLTEEQKTKLLSIGIKPGVSQAELSWREQYGRAEEFYRIHGNLSISKRYTAGNGKNLGVWLQRQRAGRRSGKLSAWLVAMLDGIGMVWESPDAWEVGFAHAKKYFLTNGDLLVPNHYVCPDGYRLGKWISNQRLAYGGSAKKRLEERKAQQLEAFGMVWNVGQGRRPGK